MEKQLLVEKFAFFSDIQETFGVLTKVESRILTRLLVKLEPVSTRELRNYWIEELALIESQHAFGDMHLGAEEKKQVQELSKTAGKNRTKYIASLEKILRKHSMVKKMVKKIPSREKIESCLASLKALGLVDNRAVIKGEKIRERMTTLWFVKPEIRRTFEEKRKLLMQELIEAHNKHKYQDWKSLMLELTEITYFYNLDDFVYNIEHPNGAKIVNFR